MKSIILIVTILFSVVVRSQVGVNTENPQQVFHVDGRSDNPTSGVPNLTQQENDFVLTEEGTVGIGTISPLAQLHITGNMILGTSTPTNGEQGFAPVVRDELSGELRVATTSTGNSYIFNYITYQLDNVNGDWISDFNTNIDTSQYTLAIIGSSFDSPLKLTSGNDGYAPNNVYAYQDAGTWHISADYRGVNTLGNISGKWTIYCFIINNTFVNQLGIFNSNLAGSNEGSGATPEGL